MTKVYFNKSDLTIDIVLEDEKEWSYVIDLERCTDSAQMLDSLFQLQLKTWCTPQILFDVFKEIDKACAEIQGKNAQAVFCPLGENQAVQW